jgi:endonuclease YncB( thermonuclease family)
MPLLNIFDPNKAFCVSNHDGDTIKVKSWGLNPFKVWTIRILGVQCPEIVNPLKIGSIDEPFGLEATDFTSKFCKGKWVTITRDLHPQNQQDKFGRELGFVDVDGSDLGSHLIEKGLATVFDYEKKGFAKLKEYRLYRQFASRLRLGLWSITEF